MFKPAAHDNNKKKNLAVEDALQYERSIRAGMALSQAGWAALWEGLLPDFPRIIQNLDALKLPERFLVDMLGGVIQSVWDTGRAPDKKAIFDIITAFEKEKSRISAPLSARIPTSAASTSHSAMVDRMGKDAATVPTRRNTHRTTRPQDVDDESFDEDPQKARKHELMGREEQATKIKESENKKAMKQQIEAARKETAAKEKEKQRRVQAAQQKTTLMDNEKEQVGRKTRLRGWDTDGKEEILDPEEMEDAEETEGSGKASGKKLVKGMLKAARHSRSAMAPPFKKARLVSEPEHAHDEPNIDGQESGRDSDVAEVPEPARRSKFTLGECRSLEAEGAAPPLDLDAAMVIILEESNMLRDELHELRKHMMDFFNECRIRDEEHEQELLWQISAVIAKSVTEETHDFQNATVQESPWLIDWQKRDAVKEAKPREQDKPVRTQAECEGWQEQQHGQEEQQQQDDKQQENAQQEQLDNQHQQQGDKQQYEELQPQEEPESQPQESQQKGQKLALAEQPVITAGATAHYVQPDHEPELLRQGGAHSVSNAHMDANEEGPPQEGRNLPLAQVARSSVAQQVPPTAGDMDSDHIEVYSKSAMPQSTPLRRAAASTAKNMKGAANPASRTKAQGTNRSKGRKRK